ncbi:MAG: DUF1553 domain-containing protein [Planctomycetota bacterium]
MTENEHPSAGLRRGIRRTEERVPVCLWRLVRRLLPSLLVAVVSGAVVSGAVVGLATGEVRADTSVSFLEDVIPVLTRYGCNSGGCHGKLAGQNGFRLSLRGYAPEQDFEWLVRESRGRRWNAAAPSESLLLKKATGSSPHGGGGRFDSAHPAAELLTRWIAAGAPGPIADEPRVVKLELTPAHTTPALGQSLPMRTVAVYADGRRRDVTWLTQFSAGDSTVLDVSADGVVQPLRAGESVVRATFQGQVEIATFTMPYPGTAAADWYAERRNAVDQAIFDKLAALRIQPSPSCDDSTFIRRAYIDTIGTLPTADEVRAFLADTRSDKRAQLVEQLLGRPEFVDYWALILGDLLQNRKERDHDVRGTKGVRSLHQWLRTQLAAGKNWGEIATAILSVTGRSDERPEVGYYIVTVGEQPAEKSEIGDSVAQAFLGSRIGCARCHNHPLERFTQDDYYHFIGFFSRVALDRKRPEEAATELIIGDNNLLNLRRQLKQEGDKLAMLQATNAEEKKDAKAIEELQKRIADLNTQMEKARLAPVAVRQPRTGKELAPQFLDRSPAALTAGSDPRAALAKWLVQPDNRLFSGAMVNRLWRHFMGIGLVEPVDDLRATNPPSNQALWDLLNREFVTNRYDLKAIMRLIMNSRAYQMSSETLSTNATDTRFHSHYYARRMPAEVLLDGISQVTGLPESFPGYPLGLRAIQVPDPGADSYFLGLFGRSERTTACACERSGEVTLPQLLHLQNNDGLLQKVRSADGLLAGLLKRESDAQKVIEECYLITLGRFPAAAEKTTLLGSLGGTAAWATEAERNEAFQDLLWALLNSKEFAFQH